MKLVDKLSYDNHLKQTRHHLGDLISTISECKQALIDGQALRDIATANLTYIENISSHIT